MRPRFVLEPLWGRGRADHTAERALQEHLHAYLRWNHIRIQGSTHGKYIKFNKLATELCQLNH